MLKWFERNDGNGQSIISSRIRLARNWREYVFPGKLTDEESREMVLRLRGGLSELHEVEGKVYEYAMAEDLTELDRLALRERRVINDTVVTKKAPMAVIVSRDEDTSIVLNGDDHIRLRMMGPGLCLEELWSRADKIDDYISLRFPYSFDEKYGYLTSFPTNVGTGLRASVVVHLPTLSMGRKFGSLIADMSRFGASVRGVYGEGRENYGALYEISNQKTLGQSEKEIIEVVSRVSTQLANQEAQVREMSLENHRLEREDEAYKSYGVLKYARRLSAKDAMTFLSQLMAGIADGILETEEPCSIYRLMLGIQTSNLRKLSDRPLGKAELDVARAAFLRKELPELK